MTTTLLFTTTNDPVPDVPAFSIGEEIIVFKNGKTISGRITEIVPTNAGILYRIDDTGILYTPANLRRVAPLKTHISDFRYSTN